MIRVRTRAGAVLAAGAVALAAAGTAVAAHPESGKKFSGTTSGPEMNGFKPAVTFKTASNGARILKFVFQSGGCFGSGGPTQPGVNYLAKPWNVHLVGTIKVGSDGKFSVKNAKSTYKVAVQGSTQSTVTTASVSGKFTNRKTATGTITYSQAYSQPGVPGSSCGPVKLTFKATVK
ncbi:MAG TPA: hypothetical protein VKT31_03075 [Solirubrobacteraceae bacterium]|nr:hypothetical protein [Solirubrobacteraceae bacterium]